MTRLWQPLEYACMRRKNINSESYCASEIGGLHYFLVTKTDCFKKPLASLVLTVADAHSVNINTEWAAVQCLSLTGGILSPAQGNKALKALLRSLFVTGCLDFCRQSRESKLNYLEWRH